MIGMAGSDYKADKWPVHERAEKAEARIKVLEKAIEFYELALKVSWPQGAVGSAFDHWNTARRINHE